MINAENVKTITQLRTNPLKVFKESAAEPTFIFSRSRPVGVVMSVEEYNDLMETLEDYFDSLELKEAAAATKDKGLIPLDKFWERYKLNK